MERGVQDKAVIECGTRKGVRWIAVIHMAIGGLIGLAILNTGLNPASAVVLAVPALIFLQGFATQFRSCRVTIDTLAKSVHYRKGLAGITIEGTATFDELRQVRPRAVGWLSERLFDVVLITDRGAKIILAECPYSYLVGFSGIEPFAYSVGMSHALGLPVQETKRPWWLRAA